MGVISIDKNEIKLYYHSGNRIGKQVHGYVMAADRKILAIDVSRTKVTGTQWVELAKGLGLRVADLINKEHPNFVNIYGENVDLDTNDWIKVLDNNPEVLTNPIAIVGTKYVQLQSQSDVVKFLEPDSKDIKE